MPLGVGYCDHENPVLPIKKDHKIRKLLKEHSSGSVQVGRAGERMRSRIEQRCEKLVSKPPAKHSAALGVPFRRFPGLAPGALINSY